MMFVLKCVLLILHFAFFERVQSRCDYRNTRFGWFKYHEKPAIWEEARLRCHLEGGILASPTTRDIRNWMLELSSNPEIFTGVSAMFSTADFYTIDGIPLCEITHQWAPNEPDTNNNTKNCVVLRSDRQLSAVRCDEARPYICHRELSNLNVTVCGTTDPEYRFVSQTNKCYKFHTKAATFERAHMTCSAEEAHLAIINSEEEAQVITQIFDKYPEGNIVGSDHRDLAILGFKYWFSNEEWTTIHGESIQKAGYAQWAPDQPDNDKGREYCGSVYRSGLLNDIDCEVNHAFICEKDPN